MCVCAGARVQAQDSGAQQPSSQPQQGSSSSSQQAPETGQPAQTPEYGVYMAVDPLAKVRYDNRYDLSVGMAYDHMKAGPNLLQGSNLGGLDVSGSYWLTRNWGIEASVSYTHLTLPTTPYV